MLQATRTERRRRATLLYIGGGAGDERLLDWLRAEPGTYRTLFALQGRLGCDLAHRTRPDLVLVGSPPPDMSVAEVVAGLRVPGPSPAPPVLLLAAGGAAGSGHGTDAVLDTTCDEHELRGALERLLGHGG
jgi:CheY-like chemotaxis protein